MAELKRTAKGYEDPKALARTNFVSLFKVSVPVRARDQQKH